MIERDVLRGLLEIELSNFAIKLGFVGGGCQSVPYKLLIQSLNLLKNISNRDESDFNRQIAIAVVALVWTHSDESIKESLRQIISPILSSMGFAPSNLMIDGLLKTQGVYSPIGSYFDKLRIIAHDLKNEIRVADRSYTLTGFQSELWKVLNEHRLVGVSAPTSAGKSFLLYLRIVDLILKGGTCIVYVVPTLSLISQVTSDLTKLLRSHSIRGVEVLNSFEDRVDRVIYVVTQERAIVLFSGGGVDQLDLLVVDEIQNLEKVAAEGENRPKILYDILMDVRNDIDVGQVVLSGPRLRNIGNLGFRIFGETSTEKTTDAPPVLSLTYSISNKKSRHFLNQYSSIFDLPCQLEIKNSEVIGGLGQVQYTQKFNDYLHYVLDRLRDDVNVVFSPTSNQARKSAESYVAYKVGNENASLDECMDLASYLRKSVHPKYELAAMVEGGVAYHTGKTPMHVRKSVEYATSKKWVNTLFCTTTLMQGVNLPANNVVIRNPNLFTRRKQSRDISLSAYEFANLRGRAGRLLVDFIGRTIVLDEGSFSTDLDHESGNSLFPDEYKEIVAGYQEVYEGKSDLVDFALSESCDVDDVSAKSLVSYIRQTIFRYGLEGDVRLKNVGINIDRDLLLDVQKSLSEITVERNVVIENRYWDPLDLDKMYRIFLQSGRDFPVNVFERGLANSLLNWIYVLRDKFSPYFSRYLGSAYDDKYLYGIAKSAESWAREVPLVDILIGRFGYDGDGLNDKIDSEIEKLTKYVSFGLPMLLKPLADMRSSEMSIISAIELGVYSPIPKYLIDRGVPRETAIKVGRLYADKGYARVGEEVDLSIIKTELNRWEAQHVAHIAE